MAHRGTSSDSQVDGSLPLCAMLRELAHQNALKPNRACSLTHDMINERLFGRLVTKGSMHNFTHYRHVSAM